MVAKLWASAQLWVIQHFLLDRATPVVVGFVVCKS